MKTVMYVNRLDGKTISVDLMLTPQGEPIAPGLGDTIVLFDQRGFTFVSKVVERLWDYTSREFYVYATEENR